MKSKKVETFIQYLCAISESEEHTPQKRNKLNSQSKNLNAKFSKWKNVSYSLERDYLISLSTTKKQDKNERGKKKINLDNFFFYTKFNFLFDNIKGKNNVSVRL